MSVLRTTKLSLDPGKTFASIKNPGILSGNSYLALNSGPKKKSWSGSVEMIPTRRTGDTLRGSYSWPRIPEEIHLCSDSNCRFFEICLGDEQVCRQSLVRFGDLPKEVRMRSAKIGPAVDGSNIYPRIRV